MEWNIRDAWVKNAVREKFIDCKKSSLQVVSYSVPVRRNMPLAELRKHLHALPDSPDWVPLPHLLLQAGASARHTTSFKTSRTVSTRSASTRDSKTAQLRRVLPFRQAL
jgi:Domain of unknown function (DUF2172)